MDFGVKHFYSRWVNNARRTRFALGALALLIASGTLTGAADAATLTGSYTAQTCNGGCAAGTATWNTNCSATYSALAAGGTANVTNTAAGYTGSVTLTCNAGGSGAVAQSSATCSANACNLPWGGTTASGTSVTAYLSATPAGACTSQSRTCTAGTLSGTYTAQTCTAGCASSAQTWLTNCNATAAAAVAGGTQSLTNAAVGYTGSATATCNAGGAGTFALSTTSCASTSCTLPWGGTTATGTSVTAYLSATPAGACTSQTRTCTNGTLSGTYTAQSCTAGCASQSVAWLTNCNATASAAVAGGTQSLTNGAANYSGTATATCNAGGAGTFATSGTSCTATETCTLPWGGTILVGQSVTAYLSATPAGACTSQTRTCNTGTNGTCGSANGSYKALGCPSTNLCSAGSVDGPYDDGAGTCNWDCLGTGGGTTASCSSTNDGGCFTGDAMITMADGSTKPIAELKKGDKVRGKGGVNTVIYPETHWSDETLYGFNGGPIFVTGEHMLMTTKGWGSIDPELARHEGNGKYNPRKLEVGDTLVLDNGEELVITSIDQRTDGKRVQLFNPSLDGDHTYYVNGILVHNIKCSTC